MQVEIQNWNDLKSQFGLTDTKKGEKKPQSARQLSKALYNKVKAQNGKPIEDGLLVPCGEFSEIDCIFRLVGESNNKFVFSFEGTIG